jgi:hypothetical protein
MPVGVWDIICSAPLIDFRRIYLPCIRVEGLEVGEGVGARELWFSCIAHDRDSVVPRLERYDGDVVNILICSLFFVPFLSVWIEFPLPRLSSQSDRT